MLLVDKFSRTSSCAPKGYRGTMVVLLLVSVINATVLGYDSMMLGSILNLPSYTSYFSLTPVTIGLNTSAMWMGQIIAAIFLNQLFIDHLGRKTAILSSVLISFIGVALQSAAQNIGMFVVGRIFLGLGCNIGVSSAALLVGEIAPAKYRGLFLGLAFTSFYIGSLVASGVTFSSRNVAGTWAWRIPSIVQGAVSGLAAFSIYFVSESPYWLIAHHRMDEAILVIQISQGINLEEATSLGKYYEERIELDKDLIPKHPWRELFHGSVNIRRVLIMISQAAITEMSGAAVGNFFLSILLDQAGVTSTTQKLQVNIVMSAWGLICAASGSYMFDFLGRKKQSLISMVGMICSLCILGGLIKAYGQSTNTKGMYASIAMIFFFTGFYSFTYTPLTTLYPAEIWNYKLRSAGVAFFMVFNCGFGLMNSFVLPIAMTEIGWKFYMINAGYNVIFIPIIAFLWVETKGIPLAEVDELFLKSYTSKKAELGDESASS
ncbi:high-affinity glucose transporter [[Candida] anglica]|uniref:High-affinity glucose transporter n=1 Tax=[Candida] anglica TaxID=148631 RepID=A0ABP0EJB6_9ASCO